jgi:hypothetical protein
MSNKNYLWIVLFVLALLVVACNYPGYLKVPAQPSVVSSPTSVVDSDLDQILVDPSCSSLLAPGRWVGSVSTNTTASSMGFRIIHQTASISLELDITCDGDITGRANRQGDGEIKVPFMLDGTCIENARYQVSGMVLADDPSRPVLSLTFTTIEGALSCNLNSNVSSIPSGEQTKNLTEDSFSVDMTPESLATTQISGSQWPDTFYQDQFSGTQAVMEEYDITTQTTASWQLILQK